MTDKELGILAQYSREIDLEGFKQLQRDVASFENTATAEEIAGYIARAYDEMARTWMLILATGKALGRPWADVEPEEWLERFADWLRGDDEN